MLWWHESVSHRLLPAAWDAGGDQAQLAARKPVLEALVSSLLGGGPAAAAVRQVTRLAALPSRTAVGRRLQAAASTPAAPPPVLDMYSSGARLAVMQHEAPGGHLQSGWRLLAGGTEVSFGERSGDSVASFLQYEAASAAGAKHDLSMASMQSGSGTVAAANLAAGTPAGTLPQPVAAGGAAAGQQAGVGVRPQGSLPGSLPAGQQAIPGRPQAAVPGNPMLQQPGGKQQPRGPAANGGMAGQPAGMGGPQPGAAAANGAALWQAVGQLQAGVPGGKQSAAQQAAGVQLRAPAAPTGAAAQPAGGQQAAPAAKQAGTQQPLPAAPSAAAAMKPVVGELPAPPAPKPAAGQAPVAAAPSSVATQPSVQGVLQVCRWACWLGSWARSLPLLSDHRWLELAAVHAVQHSQRLPPSSAPLPSRSP